MTRRSTRLSKRSASPPPEDVPRKRPRTKRSPEQSATLEGSEPRKRRRIAGKLASIMNMPVDVFCEIASNLSPEDLLRIARASKGLRNLLMSKSSSVIWAAAEKSVGLPRCPPDLSCPQYASLVFDKFCMNCLAPRARPVNVMTRARLCKRCEATEVVSGAGLLPTDMGIEDLEALIPGDKLDGAYKEYWYETRQKFYLPLHVLGQRYYKALIIPACQDYVASGMDRTWLIERSKRLYQLKLHACKLSNWLNDRLQDKIRETRDLKQSRRAAIYRRLQDLGYTEADCSTTRDDRGWKWDTLIDQTRGLTEKVWAQVKPRLENTIRLRREKNFRIARQECVTSRERLIEEFTLSVMKSNEVKLVLSFEEILQSPDILHIINADGLNTMLSEGDFQVVKTNVIELGTKRKQEEAELCGAAMAAAFADCGILPANVNTDDCGENKPSHHPSLSASNVLEHSCSLFALKGSTYIASRASFNDLVSFHQPMDVKLSEFYAPDSKAISIAKRLAEDLGVINLTLSELDSLKECIVCSRCDPMIRKKMDWKHFVQHFLRVGKDFDHMLALITGCNYGVVISVN